MGHEGQRAATADIRPATFNQGVLGSIPRRLTKSFGRLRDAASLQEGPWWRIGGVWWRWRGTDPRSGTECRLRLHGCAPNPLVEPVHDVALLARAVVRVIVARDLDRGVARLLGGGALGSPPFTGRRSISY